MQNLFWMGSSRHNVKAFPDEARREAGFQLDRLQQGLDPEDWKPMTSIGSGVREIRIRDESGAYRVIYVVKVRSPSMYCTASRRPHKRRRCTICAWRRNASSK